MVRREQLRGDRLRPVGVEEVPPDLRGRVRRRADRFDHLDASRSSRRRRRRMPLVHRVRLRLAVDVERRRGGAGCRPPSGPRSARTRHHASVREGTPARSRRSASNTGGNNVTASSASTKRTRPRALERLRVRAPDARDRHLAAPRREPVAEAAVDRLLRRPQRSDRLAAAMRVRELRLHHLAQRAAPAMHRVHADDGDAGARQRAAGHGEVERERARAADDLVAVERGERPVELDVPGGSGRAAPRRADARRDGRSQLIARASSSRSRHGRTVKVTTGETSYETRTVNTSTLSAPRVVIPICAELSTFVAWSL